MSSYRPGGRLFLAIALIWFVAAILLGISGRIEQLEPPVPQLVIVLLTALLIAAGVWIASFRQWLRALPLRGIVLFHVTRLVGIAFIVLASRHQLPDTFALPAGWGDISVAVAALALGAYGLNTSRGRMWTWVWNFAGLVDIILAVLQAARHAIAEPASMAALLRFPLSLVPTFLVPLIIASHVLIFWRLKLDRHASSAYSEGVIQ
jgi:hypothetical protein